MLIATNLHINALITSGIIVVDGILPFNPKLDPYRTKRDNLRTNKNKSKEDKYEKKK